MSIDKTLQDRGKRYGDFKDHAFLTQELKSVMKSQEGWRTLSHDKKEAL